MRKVVFKIFMVMSLLICSISFISCEAITAQNIKNTDSNSEMNGATGKPANATRNAGTGTNGNQGVNQ